MVLFQFASVKMRSWSNLEVYEFFRSQQALIGEFTGKKRDIL